MNRVDFSLCAETLEIPKAAGLNEENPLLFFSRFRRKRTAAGEWYRKVQIGIGSGYRAVGNQAKRPLQKDGG